MVTSAGDGLNTSEPVYPTRVSAYPVHNAGDIGQSPGQRSEVSHPQRRQSIARISLPKVPL